MSRYRSSTGIFTGRHRVLASVHGTRKPKMWGWLLTLSRRPGPAVPGSSPLADPAPSLRVWERGDGVTIGCRCGCFFFSFRSIAVARRGRFRCLICDTERPIADLIHADGRPCARGTGAAGHDVPR